MSITLLQLFATFVIYLLPAFAWAQSQNLTFIEGFVNSLNDLGFGSFTQTLLRINQTTAGQNILASLPNGNFTVFVPSNQAFADLNATNASVAGDLPTLASIISYHVLPGDFLEPNATSPTGGNATTNATLISAISPNVTIGRTLLDNSSFVQLEGNKSQVLAWSIFPNNETNTTQTILNQNPTRANVTVFNTTIIGNTLLAFVTAVIIPPQNLTTVLSANNLTITERLLNTATITQSNVTNTTILNFLSAQRGFTAFVPNDQAFASVNVGSLQNNLPNLNIILRNSIINDTTVYSPILFNKSIIQVSAAGEPYSFTSNSTGNFVTVGFPATVGNFSGSITARIIQSDILVSNGVLHIIDTPLVLTANDPAAASTAFLSASSAATVSTSATGPIGSVVTSFPSSVPSSSVSVVTTTIGSRRWMKGLGI